MFPFHLFISFVLINITENELNLYRSGRHAEKRRHSGDLSQERGDADQRHHAKRERPSTDNSHRKERKERDKRKTESE